MAQNLVMRQLDERQTEHEIQLLVCSSYLLLPLGPQVYSPKMDILALALSTGAVSLYRLHWQRIWSAPPQEEGRYGVLLA